MSFIEQIMGKRKSKWKKCVFPWEGNFKTDKNTVKKVFGTRKR